MRQLLLVLVFGQQAFAQDWIGQRVITRYGTVLKVGRAVVDDEKRSQSLAVAGRDRREFRFYRVQQVNGPWLWLVAEKGDAQGWAKAENVVPYDQAIDHFTTEIRRNPSSVWYVYRGTIWHDKKAYDIALDDFNEAIRLDPSDEMAYHIRGLTWKAKKDLDKVLADYGDAIRLDPNYSAAYNSRGAVWQAKWDLDKSLADYGEAIRLDPGRSSAHRNRAWIWATCPEVRFRDGTKAIASATRACELTEWKVADGLDTLAAAYAESGEFAAAVKCQQKAMELLPKDDQSAWNDFNFRLELYRARKPYREEGKAGGLERRGRAERGAAVAMVLARCSATSRLIGAELRVGT